MKYKQTLLSITIGNRITELRKSQGMSQEKLALKAGISRNYMSGIENGKRNMTFMKLSRIVHALGITWREFFNCPAFDNKKLTEVPAVEYHLVSLDETDTESTRAESPEVAEATESKQIN